MLSPEAARMGSVYTTLRKIGMKAVGTTKHQLDKHRKLSSNRFVSNLLVPSHSKILKTSSGNRQPTSALVNLMRHKSTLAEEDYTEDYDENQDHLDLRSKGHAMAANLRASQQQQNTAATATTTNDEPWMINLGRYNDNAWLMGPREDAWFTGVHPRNCPGMDESVVSDNTDAAGPVIRSLPLPNLSAVTREDALDYFNNSWSLYETLFAGLKGEEGFYRPPPHGLRHPQIFYYGHTACLYINKLRVSGVLAKPVNAYFESIFEVGVDEMLWDDMHKNDMLWPSVSEVHAYRKQVYDTVVEAIKTHPSLDNNNNGGSGVVVDQSHPMWALFMGFEHERIHFETSSVLFRETPYHLVQTPDNWPPMHPSAWRSNSPSSRPKVGIDYPTNPMIAVDDAKKIDLGKPADFPSFGWDNEYGERNMDVPPFSASQHMVTNGEYYDFVSDGGYRTQKWWCDDGWAWRVHRNMKWPFFWEPAGPAGSHEYNLRTIFKIVNMPWDWPVDVNYYEAKAFCRWKTEKDASSRPYRLLTEAEHHILRHKEHNLEAARRNVDADKVMVTSGHKFSDGNTGSNLNLAYTSQNPVDYFAPSQTGHYDTTGNAWEWTEDHFNPLKGFEVHHVYDDFSTPCFDGKHSIIVGGSFMSTGDEASVFARFHFRPHFLQHSGFRVVASDDEAPATHLYAGNFSGQAAARDAAAIADDDSANTTISEDSGSNGSIDNVYETETSLHMYLGLHYPSSGEKENVEPILMHDNRPDYALRFPQRVAALLAETLTPDHTGTALDIGCSVGGASFELAKHFDRVDAFDFSESFVKAAKHMQTGDEMKFFVPVEAEVFEEVIAVHEKDITPAIRSKVNFFTGDSCKIQDMVASGSLDTYDGVIMSNLLCRLPDPMACLNDLPAIVNKGGVVVMVTPFSWLPEFTPRSRWLGGFHDPVTKEAIYSKDVLRDVMGERGFEKIHEEQMPLMIREHQRKYQYIISEATGWKKVE